MRQPLRAESMQPDSVEMPLPTVSSDRWQGMYKLSPVTRFMRGVRRGVTQALAAGAVFLGSHLIAKSAAAEVDKSKPRGAQAWFETTPFGVDSALRLIHWQEGAVVDNEEFLMDNEPGAPFASFVGEYKGFLLMESGDGNIYVFRKNMKTGKLDLKKTIQQPKELPISIIKNSFVLPSGQLFFSSRVEGEGHHFALLNLTMNYTDSVYELDASLVQTLFFPEPDYIEDYFLDGNMLYLASNTSFDDKNPGARIIALQFDPDAQQWVQKWIKDLGLKANPEDPLIELRIGVKKLNDEKKILIVAINGIDRKIRIFDLENIEAEPKLELIEGFDINDTIKEIFPLQESDHILLGSNSTTVIQDFSNFSLTPDFSGKPGALSCGILTYNNGMIACRSSVFKQSKEGEYEATKNSNLIGAGRGIQNGIADQDFDDDGIPNFEDDCVDSLDFDQANEDGDELGNVCDPDYIPPEPELEAEESFPEEESETKVEPETELPPESTGEPLEEVDSSDAANGTEANADISETADELPAAEISAPDSTDVFSEVGGDTVEDARSPNPPNSEGCSCYPVSAGKTQPWLLALFAAALVRLRRQR